MSNFKFGIPLNPPKLDNDAPNIDKYHNITKESDLAIKLLLSAIGSKATLKNPHASGHPYPYTYKEVRMEYERRGLANKTIR